MLTVGGVSVTELAREFGTPAYVIDEDDFRSRARDFKQTYAEVFDSLSGGADVFYAGKAFLCTEVARWVHEEGLHLDVCTRWGAGRRDARRRPWRAHRPARQQQERRRDPRRPRARRGPHRHRLVRRDRARAAVAERARASSRRSSCASPSASRRTRTSSSPRRTRTRSSGCRSPGGHASRPPAGSSPGRTRCACSGCTATSARRSSTRPASRCRRAASSACTRRSPRELGVELPELDLGGGFGIAYTTEHDPLPPKHLAAGMAEIIERECRADGGRGAAHLDRARPGHRRAEHVHALRGRAPSSRSTSTAAPRASTSPSTAA